MRLNNLKFNPDKIEVLWVSRKVDMGSESLPILDAVILPLKKQVCSLQVLLDTTVSLETKWPL